MATKKTSRTTKTSKRTTKTPKQPEFDYTRFGSLFVAIGLVIAGLLFGLFYYMGQAKTHSEIKKLEAFQSLADYFVESLANEEAGETTYATRIGLTEDDDIYFDILRTKHENSIPTATRNERVYLQCRDRDTNQNCAYEGEYFRRIPHGIQRIQKTNRRIC